MNKQFEKIKPIFIRISKYYIFRNILHLIGIFLFTVFIIFFLCPILFKNEYVKSILNYSEKRQLIAIASLIIYIIINRWKYGITLWKRYRNTHGLQNLPLLYPDYLVAFIFFVALATALCHDSWQIKISPEMKVFIIYNVVFVVSWLIGTYYWPQRRDASEIQTVNPDKYSLSDEPISDINQDLLGREKFVDDFYNELIKLPFQDSFVFGLSGSWGEGKTSVLNLLKKKIKNNDEFFLVNFDPWYFKNEEAILNAFYKEIEHIITQNFILPDLGKTFLKYRKIITSGVVQSGIKIDFSFSGETIEETKDRIEKYILQTQKKIVIFIDDIDRLRPDEILLIFALVRHNSKFKNTVFVLSFDENYVITVLENRWSTSGHIDKKEVDLIHIKRDHVC